MGNRTKILVSGNGTFKVFEVWIGKSHRDFQLIFVLMTCAFCAGLMVGGYGGASLHFMQQPGCIAARFIS